ncbi:MAG TPA: DoxX family protein [Gemmatimonadales bacterium]|nr:DoxX family protein [Gemmatimonadales bacterium]
MHRLPDWFLYGALPLLARLLIASEFVIAVNGKIFGWAGQEAYMAAAGMTMIGPLLGAALAIEALGTLCVVTGFQARAAAAVMFVYLGIVSVRLHGFWHMAGMAAGANETQFFKNLGMMGCLLMIAVYGPGVWVVRKRALISDRSRSPSP